MKDAYERQKERESIPYHTRNLNLNAARPADECHECGVFRVSGGPVEIDGFEAMQSVYCDECGHEWMNIYRLVQRKDLS